MAPVYFHEIWLSCSAGSWVGPFYFFMFRSVLLIVLSLHCQFTYPTSQFLSVPMSSEGRIHRGTNCRWTDVTSRIISVCDTTK